VVKRKIINCSLCQALQQSDGCGENLSVNDELSMGKGVSIKYY